MGKKGHFTQQQKFDILESEKNVGIKESAGVVGVHYSTVYQWQRKLRAHAKITSHFIIPSPGRLKPFFTR